MISQVFAVVQLLLKVFGLWEQFLDYSDKARTAEAEERKQRREEAVDKQKDAQSEEEFDRAQDDIVGSNPKP